MSDENPIASDDKFTEMVTKQAIANPFQQETDALRSRAPSQLLSHEKIRLQRLDSFNQLFRQAAPIYHIAAMRGDHKAAAVIATHVLKAAKSLTMALLLVFGLTFRARSQQALPLQVADPATAEDMDYLEGRIRAVAASVAANAAAAPASSSSSVNASMIGDGSPANPLGVNSSSGTLQGNTFNAAGKLAQLDSASNLTLPYGVAAATGVFTASVGIGSATPTVPLVVVGTSNFSGPLTMPGSTAYGRLASNVLGSPTAFSDWSWNMINSTTRDNAAALGGHLRLSDGGVLTFGSSADDLFYFAPGSDGWGHLSMYGNSGTFNPSNTFTSTIYSIRTRGGIYTGYNNSGNSQVAGNPAYFTCEDDGNNCAVFLGDTAGRAWTLRSTGGGIGGYLQISDLGQYGGDAGAGEVGYFWKGGLNVTNAISAGSLTISSITNRGNLNVSGSLYVASSATIQYSLSITTGGLSVSTSATAGSPALLVSSTTAFVGVSTSNPRVALDVSGTARVVSQGDPDSGTGLELTHNPNAKTSVIRSYDRTLNKFIGMSMDGSTTSLNSASLNVVTNGFVGIPSLNPAAKLHLSSGTFLADGNVVNTIIAYGHITSSGTTPSISCNAGTAVQAAGSNDMSGQYVAGTAAANCTVTFVNAYSTKPRCWCNDESNILVIQAISATSSVKCTAAVTMSGDTITWGCMAAP